MLNDWKWSDVPQNSEEWYRLRCGKITSSNYDKICANMGKAFGEPAKKYARKKALEIMTNELDETDNLRTSYMDRGHELEPLALDLYQMETFNEVTNGGFYHNERFGDSPDGLIGTEGSIEVKSVIPSTHWITLERKKPDPSYKWQIQGHLINREWCDFVSFCPEFRPYPLFVYRVYRDDKMQKQLKERLIQFAELVDSKIEFVKNYEI
jgi:hypothetical protein